MKVQPFDCGGIKLTPENEWEESYLINLLEELHNSEFVYEKGLDEKPTETPFRAFLLNTKDKLEVVN